MPRILFPILLLAIFFQVGAEEEKGKWTVISDGVLQKIDAAGKKPDWPGMSAGIACDRISGDVFMVISGQGFWRSSDLCKNFERIDGDNIGGRCETSYSLNLDPNGKRMACFMLDGKGSMSLDDGKTWQNCKDKSRGFDNAAVDWSQENALTILAVRHEANGLLLVSQDAGKTYKELGKGFKRVGVFDSKTFVATKDKEAGILRSTDGGETWSKVSDLTPTGLVAKILKGTAYWTSAQGLLASKDSGATWSVQGSAIIAGAGPYFGKDENQIMVAAKDGLTVTADAGQTWKVAAPYPPQYQFSPNGWFENFAWDPVHDVFYASRMGKPAYKFERLP